jgi:hypothetical protein
MEKTIINPIVFLIACLTSGLFTGILGCCCCSPFFSGIGTSLIYKYIEKKSLQFSHVIIASFLSGVIASIPTILINLLMTEYTKKNQHLIPPYMKPYFEQMEQADQSILGTILSLSFFTIILSIIGGIIHHLFTVKQPKR